MKVIVDAQLPFSLCVFFSNNRIDALHTFNLPLKNQTPDSVINMIAVEQNRILITKDDDFLNSFLVQRIPPKLIMVKTGNISNKKLIDLFRTNLIRISELMKTHKLIEINKSEIIVHE